MTAETKNQGACRPVWKAPGIGFVCLLLAFHGLAGAEAGSVPAGAGLSVPGRRKAEDPNAIRLATPLVPLGPTLVPRAELRRLVQPPLLAGQLEALQRDVRPGPKGRLQIGVGRGLEQPFTLNSTTVGAGEWSRLPSGWRLWSVQVSSPGALGLRVHLEAVSLPAGARILVYDPAHPASAVSAVGEADLVNGNELWTETIFAESAVLECQVPPGADPAAVTFRILAVSHLYRSPLAKSLAKEGSCHNDVTCYPEWAPEAAGTARMVFIDGSDTYLCTGCLLNTTSPGAALDYFLTANHCIDSQAVASTLELYWFYQTSACDGPAPALASAPHTAGGADYLAGSSDSDYAFMRLRRAPPAGVYYLGWSTAAPASGETLVSIHHPDASYKRICFGKSTGSAGVFWNLRWFSGVTEPGSSGCPLLNAQHQVIGQLYGGFSSCAAPQGIDLYGRFDWTYQAIQSWLDPAGKGASQTGLDGNITAGGGTAGVLPAKGTYRGLFQEPAGVALGSSGAFTLSVTAKGTFTGQFRLGASRYSASGRFDVSQGAQFTIARRGLNRLQVNLQADAANPSQLIGSLSDGQWTAQAAAEQAAFEPRTRPAPQAGQYTLVLGGSADAAAAPGGSGYGVVSITKGGSVSLTGTLADGTAISQSAALGSSGRWPLFLPLYQGQGLLVSWVQFADEPSADLSGQAVWIKASGAERKLYPGGFTLVSTVTGSSYRRPGSGRSVLELPQATLVLESGGLTEDFAAPFSLGTNNRVTSTAGKKLSLSFVTASGLFRGRVTLPAPAAAISFGGVVLQKANFGMGNFVRGGESGAVRIQGP